MEEIFKDIEGYEGLYQISNLGRVKSLCRVVTTTDGRIRTLKEKILSLGLNTYGYNYLGLCKGGKRKFITIHRLVADTFIPNPDNKPQVNHINGIKTDNTIDNLEWTTAKENMRHAVNSKLKISSKGTEHGMSKLTEKEVLEIRESNLSQRKLAKLYAVTQPLISSIKRREIWKHI